MRNFVSRAIVILAAFVVVRAGSVAAQDWPQWRGPNRDDKASGFIAPKVWPQQLTPKWKVAVGAGGDSTPALVGDRLYVFAREGGEEVTLCLNAVTGQEIWRDKYPCPAVSGASASVHPGPRSSPAVSDGKVVTLGATGIVSCLDAATGKLVWRKDDYPNGYPQFYTAMSPMILDGMAVAQVGSPRDGGMIAYDLGTGEAKWKWTGDGPAYSSPVLMAVDGSRQFVTMTDKLVVGVSVVDGKLLWQVPFAVTGRAYNAATPVVDGQTVYIIGAGRGAKAYKIEKDGAAFKATELWSNPQLAVQFNTPVLKEGFLYGLSDRGTLFCINASTGQAAWTDSTRYTQFGSIVDAGSELLALTQGSQLVVLKPDSKAYSQIAKVKVADKDTYAHPIASGNRLFVRDMDSVAMYALD